MTLEFVPMVRVMVGSVVTILISGRLIDGFGDGGACSDGSDDWSL